MGSLTEIRANRLRVLRDLRRAQKEVDTRVEKLERLLIRLLGRKLKLPQFEDLEVIIGLMQEIDVATSAMVQAGQNALIGFRF